MIWAIYGGHPDILGMLPGFFSEHDPRTAWDQLVDNYTFGGLASPFEGFELEGELDAPAKLKIKDPGDPAYKAVASAKMREELIVLFPYAWVAIVQPDRKMQIMRVD